MTCIFLPLLMLYQQAFADAVEIKRTADIKRPLKEIAQIILAYDKTCETGCLYPQAKLKTSKILERSAHELIIWTDFAEILPTRTYKKVIINCTR